MKDTQQLVDEIDQLKTALKSRGDISLALRLVMGRYELDEETAFAYLVRISQNCNVKLARLAADVRTTGVIPTPPLTERERVYVDDVLSSVVGS